MPIKNVDLILKRERKWTAFFVSEKMSIRTLCLQNIDAGFEVMPTKNVNFDKEK